MLKNFIKVFLVSFVFSEMFLYFLEYPSYWEIDQLSSFNEYIHPDTEKGWSLKDQSIKLYGNVENNIFNFTVVNEERITPRVDSSPRLLFFGDSYVMGYGLDDTETFPWLLQNIMPEYNIENLGISGFGTCQVLKYVDSSIKYNKIKAEDSIFYVLNDFHETRNVYPELSVKLSPKRKDDLSKYKFCNTTTDSIGNIQINLNSIEPSNVWERNLRTYIFLKDFYSYLKLKIMKQEIRNITFTLIKKIKESLDLHKTSFFVVLFDVRESPRLQYIEYLKSNKIEFIDCSYVVMQNNDLRLMDGHPNKKMNALLAECLKTNLLLMNDSSQAHS